MIITKATANKLTKAAKAVATTTVTHDGWRWQAYDRMDVCRVDHVRLERI
jgi:hypothetical protein